ncbi:MAG: flagellar hook-basal body complex protein FliE [Desulfobacteraceae bacterium]|nr:flagellar hook-basal body complex protein FliE [Desulfobacteraceae bacterium]
MMEIPKITGLSSPQIDSSIKKNATTETVNAFGNFLKESIRNVNKQQVVADKAAADLATGQETDIHGTMITLQKAGISFELLMQVRNKVISAYEEIKRMQI